MKRISLIIGLIVLSGIAASAAPAIAKRLPAENRKPLEFNSRAETRLKKSTVRRKTSKFSGRWTGKLYQPAGPAQQKYNFSLTLFQKGKKITGFSRIAVIGAPQYYGVMRLSGTIKGNRLVFREIKVTRDAPAPETFWCIKSGSLKLARKDGKTRLKGFWQAGTCSPGTIVLRKVSRK
jgi:hypothetical protein